MLNKNVANYTDFEGKTNKKIVQAPGGSSTLSFAWGNQQKTDYGPPRHFKKNQAQTEFSNAQLPSRCQQVANEIYPPSKFPPTPNRHTPGNHYPQRHSQHISILGQPIPSMGEPIPYIGNSRRQELGTRLRAQNGQIGGQFGYDNYAHGQQLRRQQLYQQNLLQEQLRREQLNRQQYRQLQSKEQQSPYKGKIGHHSEYKTEMIDLAVEEHRQKKDQTKNSDMIPGRSCIKMSMQPKVSLLLGDQNYNYWKDKTQQPKKGQQEDRKKSVHSQNNYRNNYPGYKEAENYANTPLLKVDDKPTQRNPPGGKSTFTFG